MANRRTVPRFKTEKEEADWWYRNRDKIAGDFEQASKKGELCPARAEARPTRGVN